MLEIVAAAILASLVCLAFKATRTVGVAFAALLTLLMSYRFPTLFLTLVVVAGVFTLLYVFHYYKRGASHAIRKLLNRSD